MATPSYLPCSGTGLYGEDPRRVVGATGKHFSMNGRTYAACPACGRRLNLGRITGVTGPVPRHKAAA